MTIKSSNLQILTELAQAAAQRVVDQAPGVRFRPGVVLAETGYPPSGGTSTEEVDVGIVAQVRLDGDGVTTYAQNITGEPYPAGARVMCAYVPPHACYIIGPIDHWPTERGLISELDYSVGANPSTTSASLVEVASALRFTFTVPSSGRVRIKMFGGLIGTNGNDEPGMGLLTSGGASVASYFAGGDSTQRMGNWGEYNSTYYDRVASGLTPGDTLEWTPAIRRITGAGTSTIAIWYGSPGSIRIEVWAMPSAAAAG